MSALIFPVCLQPYFGSHSINAGYTPEDSLLQKAANFIPVIGPIIGIMKQRSLFNQQDEAITNSDTPRLIRLIEISNQYSACQFINAVVWTSLVICFVAASAFKILLCSMFVGSMLVFAYTFMREIEYLNRLRMIPPSPSS